MGKSKIDTIINLMAFKRKYQILKREHENLKEHKIKLYNHRYLYISSMKMTKNVLNYLKCKKNGINVIEYTEQNIDSTILSIKTVRYFFKI